MKCYEKCIPEKCKNGTMPLLSYYILCKCYDCIHDLGDGPVHQEIQSLVKNRVLIFRKAREQVAGKKLYPENDHNPIRGTFDPEQDIDLNDYEEDENDQIQQELDDYKNKYIRGK